ncbi:serine/threonine-protein kinase VRK3-like isoform X2 [Oncorhynchus nerka]|uniref:serine/threonine-protein kinase VRK3-like isoform X2 n=1 Tax=Oncorhynchus nerka TaxID=8023 RepID=UPI0031B889F4
MTVSGSKQKGMLFHFCPQCGTKLQPGFRFCPSCGDKLQCVVDPSGPVEVASSGVSQLHVTDGVIMTANASSPTPSTAQLTSWDTEGLVCATPSPVSTRPPLHRTCNSVPVAWSEEAPSSITSPPVTASTKHTADQSHKSVLSPRKRRALTPKEEPSVELATSPGFSSLPRSPSTVKGKAKKAKRVCAVEPLQEGEELCDTTGRKWRLLKLLSQSDAEMFYGVQQNGQGANSSDYKHILKLGAKDGKMFNEQNFLQRAAKPSSVDKWIKHAKMDFLGIPSCVGFGLHADSYRFLIFSSMGQTLQSFMDEGEGLLSEKVVLQLACRVLDVLEFIHENEYVHADIHAENIYISPAQQTQVNLAGYCHAFRYSPGGRHVEYREGSRTPNEGAIDFISLESHKGAGPSRRSDLQALGYCMLRWYTGALPWTSLTHTPARVATEKERYMEDVPGLLSHCFGQKKVSSALQVYLSQVMALQYSDQPDYRALRAGLSAALQKLGGSLEQPLDLQVRTPTQPPHYPQAPLRKQSDDHRNLEPPPPPQQV